MSFRTQSCRGECRNAVLRTIRRNRQGGHTANPLASCERYRRIRRLVSIGSLENRVLSLTLPAGLNCNPGDEPRANPSREAAPLAPNVRCSRQPLTVEPWPFSAAFVGDGPEIGLPDELGVFGEEPALVTRHRRPPSGTPCDQLVLCGDQVHAPVGDVDAHPLTVADQRKRAADRRLRRHMTGADAAGGTGEAAVGDERHLLPHLLAIDDRRHPEHLAHPRAADRAFIAHYQHLAGLIGARLDGTDAVLLALEDAGRPLMN